VKSQTLFFRKLMVLGQLLKNTLDVLQHGFGFIWQHALKDNEASVTARSTASHKSGRAKNAPPQFPRRPTTVRLLPIGKVLTRLTDFRLLGVGIVDFWFRVRLLDVWLRAVWLFDVGGFGRVGVWFGHAFTLTGEMIPKKLIHSNTTARSHGIHAG